MTNTTDFLVEIGTEELPPKALRKLEQAFARSLEQQLSDARLSHSGLRSFATPRRLAVLVTGLLSRQEDQEVERRGPPVKIAFDGDGNLTKAGQKFVDGNNTTVDQLERLATDKGEYLLYRGTQPGLAAEALLPDFVQNALAELPIPRRMRWGDSDAEFVRPVHWVVMLTDSGVIETTILGRAAGSVTYGHRFHAPKPIQLERPGDYADTLQQNGFVVPGFLDRKALVQSGAETAAADNGGKVVIPDELLDEVTALVEWPSPVVGSFDESFLRLPKEVLVSTLQEHQRYFPIHNADDSLTNQFITISNIESREPEQVRLGNEKVVEPRLSDAAFFWEQDLKTSLAEKCSGLDQVVYQKGLGTLAEKSARVATLCVEIAADLGEEAAVAERAALLAKADLLTEMVGEFPDLQGLMGCYYASRDGEDAAVAKAIEEQYLPRFAGDALPGTSVGQALAISDKLDTLAGIFALGQRPSGSKDPFALRRLALGLVRILIESNIDIDLRECTEIALALQPVEAKGDVSAELFEFITERLKAYYLDGQNPTLTGGAVTPELFEAVRQRQPASPVDFHQRLAAVAGFSHEAAAENLTASNKRIANILKASDTDIAAPREELLSESQEVSLYKAVESLRPGHEAAVQQRDYVAVLQQLTTLSEPVDAFFDGVMVNTDDEAVRANRLNLLASVRGLFLDVADLSRL